MSVTTFFKPCGVGNYEWLRCSTDPAATAADYVVGDAERLVEEGESASLVFIAPAEKIGLRVLDFDPSERKLLRQTVPYSMEDELVDDVDSLHFALGQIDGAQVDVAYIQRDAVAQWQQQFAEQQVEIQQIVSELQLLPYEQGSWTLVPGPELWQVRFGVSQGFSIEPDNAALALQLLLDNSELPPQRLRIYNPSEMSRQSVLNLLPEMLRGIVEWCDGNYWHMIADGVRQGPGAINMLQGEFAVGLPWKKWWKVWKTSAIVVVAAVVLNIAFQVVAIQVLESRNLALRADTERVYRSVVPRGAVMRPAQQLKRKVDELQGGGGEHFMPLLDRVAKVLAAIPGLEIQTLNYNAGQGELRVTILVNGFNDVEVARTNLEQAGLQAVLGGSNTDGGKTRARLTVSR